MKKFSTLLVVLMCLISLVLVGCTKADNATLTSISNKYNYIAQKQDEIFVGSRFMPTYKSDNLNNMINSENENYNVLKTDSSLDNYLNRGAYGILMEGINSTYLNSNASSVIQNNEITDKKYKKAMYLALEDLQKNVKKLDTNKTSLESVFNNDDRDALVVGEQELTKYNLKKYKNSLNTCLKNLYTFNKNYNLALNNNIIKPTSLNDLLYGLNTSTSVSYEYITMIVNNLNLMISNYTLQYSIGLKDDILDASDLLNNVATMLNVWKNLTTGDKANTLEDYKVLRTLENGLLGSENAFNNAVKVLDKNSFTDPSDKEESAIDCVENYYNELLSYSNTLIDFLENLT